MRRAEFLLHDPRKRSMQPRAGRGGRYEPGQAHASSFTRDDLRKSRIAADDGRIDRVVCLLLLAFGGMAAVDLTNSGGVTRATFRPTVSSSPPDETVYVQEGAPSAQRGPCCARLDERSVRATTPAWRPEQRVDRSQASPSTRRTRSRSRSLAVSAGGAAATTPASFTRPTAGSTGPTRRRSRRPRGRRHRRCPCDQTIDFGRDGRLYGTFLLCVPERDGLHLDERRHRIDDRRHSGRLVVLERQPRAAHDRDTHQRRPAMAAREPRPDKREPGQRVRRVRRLRRRSRRPRRGLLRSEPSQHHGRQSGRDRRARS